MSNSSSQRTLVVFTSEHTKGINFSLSRYQRRWFLVFSDFYEILNPRTARIYRVLNQPKFSRTERSDEQGRRFFWFNPTVPTSSSTKPYNFTDPTNKERDALSPIQMLLDAKPPVVRTTGRMRAETSEAWGAEEGQQTIAYEMEVLVPDEGLMRQCYYCLDWEGLQSTGRFKKCGDDLYWCEKCASNGWLNLTMSATFGRLRGQEDEWRKDRHNVYAKDSE